MLYQVSNLRNRHALQAVHEVQEHDRLVAAPAERRARKRACAGRTVTQLRDGATSSVNTRRLIGSQQV